MSVPDSCQTSDGAGPDRHDDGDSVPQHADGGIERRTFLKGVTIGAATVGSGALGTRYSTQEAEAYSAFVPIGIAAGGDALDYLGKKIDAIIGDEQDYSKYTGAEALAADIYKGCVNLQSTDERVLTSIENNIKTSENVALSKGKAAIIEKMNAEEGEDAAREAMQAEIDDFFGTIEKNLMQHFVAVSKQVIHYIEQLEAHTGENGDASVDDVFDHATHYYWDSSPYYDIKKEYDAYETFHGQEIEYPVIAFVTGSHATSGGRPVLGRQTATDPFRKAGGFNTIGYHSEVTSYRGLSVSNPAGSGNERVIPVNRIRKLLRKVSESRDSVNGALNGFVADVYAAYEPGEIPTEDLVDPITASTELSQNYDGYQAQGAHAAMLGIPTTAEQSVAMTVNAPDGEYSVLADLYTSHVPENDQQEEIGFEAGESYEPAEWDEPLYIAFEYEEQPAEEGGETEVKSDFVQLEDPFTINSVTDKEGNDVQTFKTESRNQQTADIQKMEEELAQLRKEQIRLQEESQSGGSGGFDLGFGGFGLGDIGGKTAVAVAALFAGLAGILSAER